jgi:hypothetical protein
VALIGGINMKQLLSCKVDTKINQDTLKALENYMAAKKWGKSQAIREALIIALELEGHLFSLGEKK